MGTAAETKLPGLRSLASVASNVRNRLLFDPFGIYFNSGICLPELERKCDVI